MSKPQTSPNFPYLSQVWAGRCVLLTDNAVDEVIPDAQTTVYAEVEEILRT